MSYGADFSFLRILITGASRGIGKAVAQRLSEAGARLLLVARSQEALAEFAEQLPGEAHPIPADLEGQNAPEDIIERATGYFDGLDVLVNNAGIAVGASLEETSAEEWDRHMNINARAPFLLTMAALPLLRRSEHARVINMGSVVSHEGYVRQGAYTASKHALYGLTKVLAKELHEEGIRVHFVAPGGSATDMIAGVRPDLDPAGLIAPDEVARAVLFLLSQGESAATDELSLRRGKSTPWK